MIALADPVEVIDVLDALNATFADSYQFWADDISIADEAVFDLPLIAGSTSSHVAAPPVS